ncbi:MAG: threonine/homoserine/homoserine lactone efflux protein [Granulosicoccus sp.]|jgi:threonine/homoserine/homoserine lactone efflux protein
MTFDLLTALIVFSFVSSITPGPNNLMLLASGTNFGFRRTLPHMFGVAIGFTIMVMLVGVGLIRLFDQFPTSYQILKIISVLYLIYLSWKIATVAAPALEKRNKQSSPVATPFNFIQATLFQWINPKAWAMALTAITAYTPASHPLPGVLMVALIFGAVNLPSITVWVLLGTQVRRFLSDPIKLRVFNIFAAMLLLSSLYPIIFS